MRTVILYYFLLNLGQIIQLCIFIIKLKNISISHALINLTINMF